MRRFLLLAAICGTLVACGGNDAAPVTDGKRSVNGVVMKGAVQGATVKFYDIDAAGNPMTLVASAATDANGQFTAALPVSTVHLLARTFDGSFVDESDTAATNRRRITLPASPSVGFEAVLPPNATTLAITPYSHALVIKARVQAAGMNFANVFDAVQLQATAAFGFDPITTVPADPLNPAAADSFEAVQYALLLGAAAQSINAIATSAGHLPGFADVMVFINDVSDGTVASVSLPDQIRRFRNNNFALYEGVSLPFVDETLLSQPANVPNSAPVANDDAILVSEGATVTVLADGSTTSVLANDTDAEGQALTASQDTGPSFGGLTLNPDGTFSYGHGGGEEASDSFTYVANDGTDDSAPATVTITIAAVNDAPVAVDDPSYTGSVGGTVTAIAGAGGLLDNDTDADNAAADLSVTTTPTAAPSFGTVNLSADGGFTYTHNGSANLIDTFTYEVCDLAGPQQLCDQGVATITVSAAGGQTVLPYLNSAGELRLFDPDDPANPVLIETGLSTIDFTWRTLMKATVSAGVATNIQPARLVYLSSTGTLKKVNLEPGQSRVPVQVSTIADACRINGIAEDFANPDNSIVRIDTAGDNGTCEGGSGDDFATAEAWLVPISTGPGTAGVGIGLGHCCGVTGIGDANGNLTGVLLAEDDGTGSTFFVRRRNVATLAAPAFSANFEIAGPGPTYGTLTRGLGDEHIYIRGRPAGSTTYKVVRFNVASNTLTEVHDFGVASASAFQDSFDHNTFDADRAYFTSPDGAALLAVAHTATGPGSVSTLAAASSGDKIVHVEQAGDRLVFDVDATDGTGAGIFSVLKAGGGLLTLAADDAVPTIYTLHGTNGPRIFLDRIAGTATPSYTAIAMNADGTGVSADITDAQWAGETFQNSCDFNQSCEDTIGPAAVFLRRLASTNEAKIELADATGAPTGNYLGSIFNVFDGPGAFAVGFGQYAQITVFALTSQTDLFLGDTTQAGATPPSTALVAVANAPPAGDNLWLLFGDGEDSGPGGLDTDGDGLSDTTEATLGTNPNAVDTDGDGLTDFDEVNLDGNPDNYTAGVDTNPTAFDSDGDGFSDGNELAFGGNPSGYEPGSDTSPFDPDSDDDDVGDGVEAGTSSNPLATNAVYRVDCSLGLTGQDGSSWSDGAGSVGPLGSNADVLAAIGAGGASASTRVFVLYTAGTCTDPLTLTGATARANLAFVGSVGPGIYAPVSPPTTAFTVSPGASAIAISNAANLVLGNIEVTGGDAGVGGGVFVHDADGAVTNTGLQSMSIHNNTATVDGGGIAVSASSAGASLQVDDSEIFANAVSAATLGAGRGGGVFVDGAATLLMKGSSVRGNSAANTAGPDPTHGGGGIYGEGGATVVIEHTIVADNKASNGPGGGINLIAAGQGNVRNSMLLSNSATRPGAGLHMHIQSSATSFDIFNNLVIGNASTDSDAHGAGIEIEHSLAAPLNVSSNTVAYNQAVTNSAPNGGGLTISPTTGPSGPTFRNNIVAFNNDATLGFEATDNAVVATPFTSAGNNVLEPSFPGNSVGAGPNGSNPLFALDFYLNQATSSMKDFGDGLATDANNFASGFFTTDPNADPSAPSGADQGTVDIGFHHTKGSQGPVISASAFATPASAGCPAGTVFLQAFTSSGPIGPGHLVVADLLTGGPGTLSGLLTIDAIGSSSSRIATDMGNGQYRLDLNGSSPGSASYSVDVYVDGAGPFNATFFCQ